MKNAVILGASGYTGAEAVRLIMSHPKLELVGLTGHSKAGQAYGEIYPNYRHLDLPGVVTADEIDWTGVDVALPACRTGPAKKQLPV